MVDNFFCIRRHDQIFRGVEDLKRKRTLKSRKIEATDVFPTEDFAVNRAHVSRVPTDDGRPEPQAQDARRPYEDAVTSWPQAINRSKQAALFTMVDSSAFGESNANAAAENVAELQFGSEFEDIHILSNAQVAVILQVSANSAVSRDEELNEVYRKTQKYVNRFNTMTNPEKEHQELVDELDNLQE
jgi:hypothetical protein